MKTTLDCNMTYQCWYIHNMIIKISKLGWDNILFGP